ncbi:Glycosyl hydrolases family 2, sugar binding domain [Duganella sp. CF402]|uniref:glycosyl hydrolase n=1 Tax=unclassified Duganella TaxID=2636909 RepID=UPI0008CA9759|nr:MULTISPECIES: glycosyl hydrolase [unclassified Duganella]RZT08242.1 alpha-L-rhamnosidase-like protein [Duganella sp. BK701]SEM00971.1 Glycosyl hydrolases family 2, sugar binding domain [Duganella sp. CF402]
MMPLLLSRRRSAIAIAVSTALAGALAPTGGASADPLKQGFHAPPDSAKPRAWWHWLNGNVSQPGIKLDLEWMKRAGLGGFQVFDVDLVTAQYVDQRVSYQSPEWLEAMRFTAAEAERLGLEMTVSASSGWSETGGPWVRPAQAMKKYVWSETRVDGPRRFTGKIQVPPSVSGPFQNVPFHSGFAKLPPPDGSPGAKPYSKAAPPMPTFYADAAVIAYRLPDGAQQLNLPLVTTSGGTLDAALLVDGDFATSQKLPVAAQEGEPAWIQLAYPSPVRAQSVTLALGPVTHPPGALKVSSDGVHFTDVAAVPGPAHDLSSKSGVHTYAFPEVKARYFRLELGAPVRGPYDDSIGIPKATHHNVAEFSVSAAARVHRFEEKAGFAIVPEYDSIRTPAVPADMAISGESVVDLTGKLRADGTLDWEVPTGRWSILRLGYSLTGQHTIPATAEGVGLEVDKLNRTHVEAFMDGLLKPLQQGSSSTLGPHRISHLLLDSWEANQQNWTEQMLPEFRKRRGYDALPWLPVLAGHVVNSAEASDRFLWDFRRTIADLLADNHYSAIGEIAQRHGMKLYGEAMGVGLPTVGDGLQLKGRVDVPMGEFWDRRPDEKPVPNQVSDIREAASAAHIYGKNIVAAESFTATPAFGAWSRAPRDLKWLADEYMAMGVNRFVIHTSAHQPFTDRKPGVSLWRFGQNFTRNETWAELANPWTTYLSRASFMLQQGRAVNDIAYFYGEGAPVAAPFGEPDRPGIPAGYGYDYVNAEVLLEKMQVRDGRIELPSGASYGLLVLPGTTDRVSLPVLRKLRDLVAAGAVILAPKPVGMPGLADQEQADEWTAIANGLWGGADGRTVTEHRYGKGRVLWGVTVADALERIALAPDFEFSRPRADTRILATHRTGKDGDIYFVANQQLREVSFEASFRIAGKRPELWDAERGTQAPASYRTEDGRTIVSLALPAHGSVFVVFREPASTPLATVPAQQTRELAQVTGPWALSFGPGLAAPAGITLPSLSSWTASSTPAIKYYSGTASYKRKLRADPAWFRQGAALKLDLGDVREFAEVFVNGKRVDTLWRPPFVADVTCALKPGVNELEVRVTNLWPNRLIGDAQPGAVPVTFATIKPYPPNAPLLPSGLLGPVRITASTTKQGD